MSRNAEDAWSTTLHLGGADVRAVLYALAWTVRNAPIEPDRRDDLNAIAERLTLAMYRAERRRSPRPKLTASEKS